MIGLILFCIFVFITSIFSIATSALAIEAYNKNPEYKASNDTKFRFLVANLIMSIIALLFSIGVVAFLIYTGGDTAKMGKLGKLNSLLRRNKRRQSLTDRFSSYSPQPTTTYLPQSIYSQLKTPPKIPPKPIYSAQPIYSPEQTNLESATDLKYRFIPVSEE